ncbi:MAG: hypothetical protein HY093_02790 [Candidatus Liptonbacteria bacterium]|nr:hypothetical protein [Candidatus Liptonbacteria bacterium]
MNQKAKLLLGLAALLTILILMPRGLALAHGVSIPYWGPLVATCPGDVCTSLCDLLDLVQHVVYFAITILLFVIAPIIFVIGGILIMTAGGSEERMGKGRQMIKGGVIGVLITLSAYLIVGTFLWLVGNQDTGTRVSWPHVQCNLPTSPFDQPVPQGNQNPQGNVTPPGGEVLNLVDGPVSFSGGTFWYKNGRQVNPKMAEALVCTGGKLASHYSGFLSQPIRITEAYPTSSPHQDSHHSTGCAVDATPNNFNDSCNVVSNLLDAASQCGLGFKNEYEACPGGALSTEGTAPHVHLYVSACP